MPVGTIRDYLVHAGLCRWSEAILFANWHVILVNGLKAGSVDRVLHEGDRLTVDGKEIAIGPVD